MFCTYTHLLTRNYISIKISKSVATWWVYHPRFLMCTYRYLTGQTPETPFQSLCFRDFSVQVNPWKMNLTSALRTWQSMYKSILSLGMLIQDNSRARPQEIAVKSAKKWELGKRVRDSKGHLQRAHLPCSAWISSRQKVAKEAYDIREWKGFICAPEDKQSC